jgi:hypothetical protein
VNIGFPQLETRKMRPGVPHENAISFPVIVGLASLKTRKGAPMIAAIVHPVMAGDAELEIEKPCDPVFVTLMRVITGLEKLLTITPIVSHLSISQSSIVGFALGPETTNAA